MAGTPGASYKNEVKVINIKEGEQSCMVSTHLQGHGRVRSLQSIFANGQLSRRPGHYFYHVYLGRPPTCGVSYIYIQYKLNGIALN